MLFFSSPSCSHVIFVWVYIIIIISVPSPDSSSAGGILAKTGWFCERKHYLAGLMNSEMSGKSAGWSEKFRPVNELITV